MWSTSLHSLIMMVVGVISVASHHQRAAAALKRAGGRPRDSDPTNLALAISVTSHRRRGSLKRATNFVAARRGVTRRSRLLAVNGIPPRTWLMRSSSWPSTGSNPDLAHAIFFTSYDP